MNRDIQWQTVRSLAKPWLAGLLALVMLVLAFESTAHHCAADGVPHHDCAACSLAHGGVNADGCQGVVVSLCWTELSHTFVRPESPAVVSDTLLAPGRAPPA